MSGKPHISILHYAGPPIIGGVENTIYHHARFLAEAGYAVTVIAGRGAPFHPDVTFLTIPEVDSRHPEVLAVKRELDGALVSERFYRLRDALAEQLLPILRTTEALMAHNVFTLHKNLPLTAALHLLLVERALDIRALAWHHDLAWKDPQYAGEVHAGYPWDLLRTPWPGVIQVTVSEPRCQELAALYGIPPAQIHVVPPGVDIPAFLMWTETMHRIVGAFRLDDADSILLLPARITRRKNIELAIETLSALRQQAALDARLVVTGPPGAHNPANQAYLELLMALRRECGVEHAVHFLYTLGTEDEPMVPDDATMANLYLLADALLFPSREEGFGIPVLEAGLARLPAFCSAIGPLRASGRGDVHYFEPDAEPTEVAQLILDQLLPNPAFRLRQRVRKEYSWDKIILSRILPLLGEEPGE